MIDTRDSHTTVLDYDEWNRSVGDHIFNSRNAEKRIRLAVDPLVLQRAAAEGQKRHHFPSPDAAAADFAQAVGREIDSTGWWLGERVRHRVPHGLAKLALQVLAVFRISQDDIVGGSYWAALRELLGQSGERRGIMPDGLDADTHQDNWAGLIEWANEINRGRLGLLPRPDDFDSFQRHVKLPLGHGLLRLDDIQQLTRFFDLIREFVTPGEEVDPDELIPHIRRHAHDRAIFRGAHARRVLSDERLPLAAAQVAAALLQWDGCHVDLGVARGPVYRLWLSTHGGSPFRLRGGLRRIEASGEEIDVTEVAFGDLFGPGALRSAGLPVPYQPINARPVVAVRSQLDRRYQEVRQARPGDKVVFVRCVAGDDARFATSLRGLAEKERVDRSAHSDCGLPAGWVAFRLRLRDGLMERDVPAELIGRIRIGGARVRLVGGLRVRRDWMADAGPTLDVVGGVADAVIVDGRECELSGGRLYPHGCVELNQTGTHEVWLPGRNRDRLRFRVVDPPLARFHSPVVAAGWQWDADRWPTLMRSVENDRPAVRGPVVEGEWPAVGARTPPAEELVLPLALLARGVRTAKLMTERQRLRESGARHPNLLIRQLARAVPPVG
jgi:hypothetical protein